MRGPDDRPNGLLHFHVCVHCGSAFRREAFEGRALTSGIFSCPKCGREGPLNVEIRESVETETESEDASSSANSGA
jgi:DNA-directed RNA polymerase subunit M/transcription elongation factor TFIIS